jgi:protein-S-isoprenylcysteine O-methyltransferase Ste14
MTSPSGARARLPVTAWNHVRAVLLLPFTNTVVIPAVLLLLFHDAALGRGPLLADLAALVVGGAVATAGLVLVMRSISLFVRRGQGTLAPWDPTRVLIVEDIYRYSRNPMKAGLFLGLIGECIVLRSPALIIWACCFMAANVTYIRLHEEPGLRKRFGKAYATYCRSSGARQDAAPIESLGGERFS